MRRLARRTSILIACAALGATALVATSANAREVDMYDSKVTISEQAPAFHGEVKSDYQKCRNHRRVALFKVRSGDDKKIGGDQTGPAGRWKVEPEILASGEYYARVRRFQQIVSGNGYECAKDKSRVVFVD